MKLVLAIIQPAKLEAVKEALNKVEVFRLTIVDVQGFGWSVKTGRLSADGKSLRFDPPSDNVWHRKQ